jgi:hypothetical protein
LSKEWQNMLGKKKNTGEESMFTITCKFPTHANLFGEGSFFKASPETKVKKFPTRAAPLRFRVSPDSPEEWGHSQYKGPLCEVGVSQVQAQILPQKKMLVRLPLLRTLFLHMGTRFFLMECTLWSQSYLLFTHSTKLMGVFPLQVKVGCCQSGGSPTILVGHPLLWWVSTSIPFTRD